MTRRLVLIPVLLAIWIVLFAWTAGVPWTAPWTARERLAISGRDFHTQLGEASYDMDTMVVNAFGADSTGLQIARLTRVRSEKYPVLRYRITDFSEKLELALVFRSDDAPKDVQTISLPTPDDGEMVVDLSRFKEWHGEISELGFAEYATAQLVPPSLVTPLEPFRIEKAQLQAPTWDILFPRLRSDWFGYRPWSLQSINTIGPGRGTLGRSWMMPILAAGAVLSGLAIWIVLRLPRARAVVLGCGLAACTWLVLDLRWLIDLAGKHQVTETVYAGKPWTERLALQPDEDNWQVAADVARIAEQQGVRRVFVQADSAFTVLRLTYLLLPLNTASLEQTIGEASASALPAQSLIALYTSDWTYDKESGHLTKGKNTIPAKPIYEKGDLRIFRYEGGNP
jgi:hypothetical protein